MNQNREKNSYGFVGVSLGHPQAIFGVKGVWGLAAFRWRVRRIQKCFSVRFKTSGESRCGAESLPGAWRLVPGAWRLAGRNGPFRLFLSQRLGFYRAGS